MKIGTSVGTNDLGLTQFLRYHLKRGEIDYIELHARYDATLQQLLAWKDLAKNCEIVIHAPYDDSYSTRPRDIKFAYEVRKFLNQDTPIIFNVGVNETFDIWKDPNLLPENMPLMLSTSEAGAFCKPEDVKGNFCLDFAHAHITASFLGLNQGPFISYFLAKKPKHFHLSDIGNDYSDEYESLETGVLPLDFIIKHLPKDANVTLEIDASPEDREALILNDILIFRHLKETL